MLITIFCCISTGLCVYCILNRVNRRNIEIAVRLAVRDVEKEFEGRNATMVKQLSSKESELKKARDMVKLHEAVPSQGPATAQAAVPARPGQPKAPVKPALSAKEKAKRDGLEMFAMSRPFTDTAYDELLASSDVVKVEAAGS